MMLIGKILLIFMQNETDNYRQNHYHLLWEQKSLKNLEFRNHFSSYSRQKVTMKIISKMLNFLNMICPISSKTEIQLPATDFIRKKWLRQ